MPKLTANTFSSSLSIAPAERIFVVAYLRVSTAEQAEKGLSLQTQEESCHYETAKIGGTLVEVIRDEGVSGALYIGRPGIQKALAKIESLKGEFPAHRVVLMMMRLDRAGRKVDVIGDIRARVLACGAELHFADGLQFANTAIGTLGYHTVAAFAQFQRDHTCEITSKGRRKAAQNGRMPHRVSSPFGYHVPTKADVIRGDFSAGSEGTYQLVAAEAAIVREMFERFALGDMSLRAVCHDLTARGIPTPKGGEKWRHQTVRVILTNPAYKGAPEWGKTVAATDEGRLAEGMKSARYLVPATPDRVVVLSAPALVSEETWNAVQSALRSNPWNLSGNPRRKYLLTGFLRCPHCGTGMTGRTRPHGLRYQCGTVTGKYEGECKACGVCREYHASAMETFFADALAEFHAKPERVANAVRAFRKFSAQQAKRHKPQNIDSLIREIDANLNELNKREAATVDAQIEGIRAGTPTGVYTSRLTAIAKERAELETRRNEAHSQAGASAAQGSDSDELTAVLWLATRTDEVRNCLLSDVFTVAEKRSLLNKFWRGRLYAEPKGNEGLELFINLPDKLSTPFKYSGQIVVSVGVNHPPKIEVRAASTASAGRGRT